MGSLHQRHEIALVPGNQPSGSSGRSAPLIPVVLSNLRRLPGVIGARFDPVRFSADITLDPKRLSLGDVVRLLEDAGVGVGGVGRGRAPASR
ncbi:MAG: hypothetical protein AB7G11_03010 [Phycisphaerales bacterium]